MAETMTWVQEGGFAIEAAVDERMKFVRRTYLHLFGMLLAVSGATALLVRIGLPFQLQAPLALGGLLMLFFVLPRLLASRVSRGRQYLAAGLCIAFYGMMLAFLAQFVYLRMGSYALLGNAFVLTACVFGGLTAYVFFTRKDFSFLGGALSMGLLLVIGLSLVQFLFGGFGSGTNLLMSVGVIVLFSGFVLYDTSNILHRYGTQDHVVAAVALFIDFVVLFQQIVFLLLPRD